MQSIKFRNIQGVSKPMVETLKVGSAHSNNHLLCRNVWDQVTQ